MKKILGNKIKYFVLENDSAANKNNKKNIINIKIHKKNKIPLLVNYKYKNLQIIRRLKKKYNVNDIITL